MITCFGGPCGPELFQVHPDRLLAFLQAPGIAWPPPNTSQREWMEEEADTGVG